MDYDAFSEWMNGFWFCRARPETEAFFMKLTHTVGALLAAAGVLLAVSGGVAYFLYRISREKAYNEKWKDYVDCGLA